MIALEIIDKMAAAAFNDRSHARKPYEELPEEWKEIWRAKMWAVLRVLYKNPIHCDYCNEFHDNEVWCSVCGIHHYPDAIPYTCETGDGV